MNAAKILDEMALELERNQSGIRAISSRARAHKPLLDNISSVAERLGWVAEALRVNGVGEIEDPWGGRDFSIDGAIDEGLPDALSEE